jgi:TolB-like protein/class 3 adenylate cyclase
MVETRKLAAILVSDVVGFSRLAGADEDRTLARLRALRSDLIDPIQAVHHGRVVKRTGDGAIVEFRSAVDALRCAIEVQNGMVERNAGLPPERRIEFRIGIHVGDVVEESDGDLMGDGVNIAARLEGIAGPGGICLSEDAYRQVRDRLNEEFADLGDKELKNIARPVRAYAVKIDSPAPATVSRALAWEKPSPPRLSIVVLPFVNIGGNPEEEYFADGVTENLTTDLSRVSGSFVIARNTAFTYKGKPYDVKRIGSELNVRYVLEGSVQRGGSCMRINVQLIDAASGAHLWAERFDKPVADLFEMQDEVVARLVIALNAELTAAEARRVEQSPNPDSMDLYLQGLAWLNKGPIPENLAHARNFFERALVLDPRNVDPLVRIALIDIATNTMFSPDVAARLASAEAALAKALYLAPDHALAHLCMGLVQTHTNRAAQGIAECERALALDPNLAAAHGRIGFAKMVLGRAEETERHIREALRLSPRDPLAYLWTLFAGMAKLYIGKDEDAIAWLRRSIEFNPNISTAQFHLAAALARLGNLDEAQKVVAAGLALDPAFTIGQFQANPSSKDPIFLAERERAIEGMRKAGVPER